MVIQKQEYIGNTWFTWIYISDTHSEMLITSYKISDAEALAIQQAYYEQHKYDNDTQVEINIYTNKQLLRDAALFIKNNNPNLTQWNNYLKTLQWYDAYMVRFWIAQLAFELANRGLIQLADNTEAQVLSQLKAFIVEQPLKRLNRLLFGE